LFFALPGPHGRNARELENREQAIENLPSGPVNVGIDERTTLPNKQQVYSTIEGTISHFELVMANRGFVVPNDESYAAIEAPNGELGFYLVVTAPITPIGLAAARRPTFILPCSRS